TSSNSKNKNVDTTPRYKNDDHSGQFGTQRTVNVAGPREKVGSLVVQKSGIQCFNCKEYRHFAKECRKPKRVKDSAYHKEKMLLCKQAKQGVPLQAEQYDWLADTDEEVDEQELEAHYSYMVRSRRFSQLSQVSTQSQWNSDDERVALANLIANLKLDVDENKKIQKQLKKANTTLAQELKECKTILAETSKSLGESISVRDSCLVTLQTKQTEFEKYKAFNDRTMDYDKLELVKEKHDELMKQSLLTKSHYEGLVKQKMKIAPLAAPPTLSSQKVPVDKVPVLQAQSKIPCLYAYPYDQNSHANILIPDGEETLALEREIRSKLNKDSVRPYNYNKLNSLYEIFQPPTQEYETQLAHVNKIRRKMWQKSFVKSKPNIYKNVGFLPVSKSISKSRQAYNVMTNNINHFKQICDDAWNKHSKDLFRAATALDMEILIQTYLMPLAVKTQGNSLKFVHELKQEMHADLKYVESLEKTESIPKANGSEGLSKPITAQTLPQTAKKAANSCAKVPSNKTTNRNKPVEQNGVPHKHERQIPTGHRFSIQKTSVVQKKTMTPRSYLKWKPTGKIFKTVGLRWVPTGKIFTSSTTKVESEPLNGSNADITNQYECEQTLDVCPRNSNPSAGTSFNPKEEGLRVWLLK
nr:hypothetical protein [Tanacetum cinerariifolium]